MNEKILLNELSNLLQKGLKVNSRLSNLEKIRQKIESRKYKIFDKFDIHNEMGNLQDICSDINYQMQKIYNAIGNLEK